MSERDHQELLALRADRDALAVKAARAAYQKGIGGLIKAMPAFVEADRAVRKLERAIKKGGGQ